MLLLLHQQRAAAVECHAHQLVDVVQVEEVHLREGGVEEGEGLDDEGAVRRLLAEEDYQEVTDGLKGGRGNIRGVAILNHLYNFIIQTRAKSFGN